MIPTQPATFTIAELSEALTARAQDPCLLQPLPSTLRVQLTTDTRQLVFSSDTVQAAFIALTGENFDGHQYVLQALEKGAVLALVSAAQRTFFESQQIPEGKAILVVQDPLQAYLALAEYHRFRLQPQPIVVALTGSNGKTTTKELLYSALSQAGPTQKTEKNFNNEVGLCQTLLSLQPGTRYLVVEMAMRGRHQIDLLSEHAHPDVGLILNVGPAHIGLLGSLENIALAKAEIFAGMNPACGVGILNADDPVLMTTAARAFSGRLETYTLSDAQALELVSLPNAQEGMRFQYRGHTVQVAAPGRHQVSNALAVLKVGEVLGIPLETLIAGIERFQAPEGRWDKQPIEGCTNAWVIHDAYNANPASTRASLETFLMTVAQKEKSILVLGGMKELGQFETQYHQELGAWLASVPALPPVYLVGEEASAVLEGFRQHKKIGQNSDEVRLQAVSSVDVLIPLFQQQHPDLSNTTLLLKGSRSYQLERLLAAISTPERLGENVSSAVTVHG